MALVMETRPAAYAVIIEQGKLLMTRWAPEDRSHEPLWTLPGGGMEPGEQADETALRETLEETGYSVAIEDVLYFLNDNRCDLGACSYYCSKGMH